MSRSATGMCTGLVFMALAGCGGLDMQDGAPDYESGRTNVPDAVPRHEPRSKSGNPKSYVVFGKRYHTLDSAQGFVERGIASWYGKKFHGRRTSSGETYDMYAMTAAHKRLPLPSYVRVTNLANKRSVVVRVNDRGPFHDGRVIDLSYTAATKLGVVKNGTAPVEVRVLTPGQPAPVARGDGTIFVQAGAFSEAYNAARLRDELTTELTSPVRVVAAQINGRALHRVRIGPLDSVDGVDRLLAELSRLGVDGARVVID